MKNQYLRSSSQTEGHALWYSVTRPFSKAVWFIADLQTVLIFIETSGCLLGTFSFDQSETTICSLQTDRKDSRIKPSKCYFHLIYQTCKSSVLGLINTLVEKLKTINFRYKRSFYSRSAFQTEPHWFILYKLYRDASFVARFGIFVSSCQISPRCNYTSFALVAVFRANVRIGRYEFPIPITLARENVISVKRVYSHKSIWSCYS